MLGYLNYYALADNLDRIEYIGYLLKYSAAHTIACKHKTSLRKVFTKYGNNLTVKVNEKTTSFSYQRDIIAKNISKGLYTASKNPLDILN